jgi:hypothetical protein
MVTAVVHRTDTKTPDDALLKAEGQRSKGKPVSTYDSGIHSMERYDLGMPLTTFKSPTMQTNSPSNKATSDFTNDSRMERSQSTKQATASSSKLPTEFTPSAYIPRELRPTSIGDESVDLLNESGHLSLYGSSELFDESQGDKPFHMDEMSDSDLEIPPIDSDADVLSDSSLPLPSPPVPHAERAVYPMFTPSSPVKPSITRFSPPKGYPPIPPRTGNMSGTKLSLLFVVNCN